MRLLFLIPSFILLFISGYNLFNDFTGPEEPNYLAFKILHILVMALCIAFITLLVKSVFSVKVTEADEKASDEERVYEPGLQHS